MTGYCSSSDHPSRNALPCSFTGPNHNTKKKTGKNATTKLSNTDPHNNTAHYHRPENIPEEIVIA